MLRTFGRAGLLAVAVSLSAAAGAKAAMPVPATAAPTGGSQLTPVTFWAQPYPYRFVPQRRCPRVRVETPYGWYWDRVCAPVANEGPVLRRAY
ncbi:hypothetical protein J6500_26930 [Bradyrhizobium sp. WSM 1704]|uniref:hypothetical protein n=1 Tax=Bradyrhizobium semiaridum TaxID=2821404 RepID=UPI001CE34EA0|nr:hypothetical protein [Bradyrhizobium semiaridum]MCA6125503.1 hypothetical protein [Bradyrhizobium semiaridum]